MPAPRPATSAECPRVAETVSDVAAFSVIGQGTEVHGLGQVLRVRLGQAARDLTLAVEGREGSPGVGWMIGAEYTCAVELDPEQLVEVLRGHLVPQGRVGRRRPACSRPPTARSGSAWPVALPMEWPGHLRRARARSAPGLAVAGAADARAAARCWWRSPGFSTLVDG